MSKGMRNLIAINHVAQRQPIHIVHQKDAYNGRLVHECYNLCGIGYHRGIALKGLGWTWIKGPDGGAWNTSDPAAANEFISRGVPVSKIGNGWELEES